MGFNEPMKQKLNVYQFNLGALNLANYAGSVEVWCKGSRVFNP
jgi:hypothetical protein